MPLADFVQRLGWAAPLGHDDIGALAASRDAALSRVEPALQTLDGAPALSATVAARA